MVNRGDGTDIQKMIQRQKHQTLRKPVQQGFQAAPLLIC